jgi:hypothetical protein
MATKTTNRTISLPEARRELARMGFVRIDGLIALRLDSSEDDEEPISPSRPGSWGYNEEKGLVVADIEGGNHNECWLCDLGDNLEMGNEMKAVLRRVCPRGKGALVPCCDERTLWWRHILARNGNPNFMP